ncbi:transglycosylase domain-containing protein [Ardenticatena maritima]|nr:transglycosylase domain-containing protein [Ardenticatena maritima]
MKKVYVRIAVFFMVTVAAVAVTVWWWALRDLPSIDQLNEQVLRPSIFIYDRHGWLLYEYTGEEGKHAPISLDRVPEACIHATLATEDAGFYHHPGIDWRGIGRAVWLNLREGRLAAGGSTITQQVVRMRLLGDERYERTWRRKVREAVLALQLERRYGKDDILSFYLNDIYYGNFAYGIEAAAQAYFGKHVWELDTAECALLAGLPQAPALYNPLVNLEAARERQRTVLRLMVRNGFLSSDEADLAAHETLHFAASPFKIEAPHFVMYVLHILETEFAEYTRAATQSLHVYTTLDLGIQDVAQRAVINRLEELQATASFDRNVHNAAVVVLDPQTGDIFAMVGNRDYFDVATDGAVNVALMPRQPGSALKPITYATAFDPQHAPNGQPLSPATVLSDVPTTFTTNDGKAYMPVNFDRRHVGPISLREALATSNNVLAVKVLQYVGVEKMVAVARSLGITSLSDPARYDLTVTLGGGEVTLLELTNAYATFATLGVWHPTRALLRLEDGGGRVLWEAPPPPGEQRLDPRVAFLISDILADPDARAPAFGRYNPLTLSFPAAAKTGTTTDFRDNWTVGYTPELVVGVWVGNTDNSSMRNVSGVDGAGPIWRDVMQTVLRDQRPTWYTPPDGLVRVEICTASGLLPTPLCPYRRLEWFLEGYAPTEYDHSFVELTIDAATGLLADEGCQGPFVKRLYRLPPPEAQTWAQENGWLLPPTQSCRAVAVHLADDDTISITSPYPDAHYRLSATRPRDVQRIPITVAGAFPRAVQSGVLLLDGEPIAHFRELPFTLFWTLQEGEHSVYAVVDDKTTETVRFIVQPPK